MAYLGPLMVSFYLNFLGNQMTNSLLIAFVMFYEFFALYTNCNVSSILNNFLESLYHAEKSENAARLRRHTGTGQ